MDSIKNVGPQQRPNDEWNTREAVGNQGNSPITIVLLVLALLIGLGDGFYSYHLSQQANLHEAQVQSDIQKSLGSHEESIQKLSEQVTETGELFTNLSQDVSSTKNHLGSTQGELKKTRQMADTLAQQQKETTEQINGQLCQIQEKQTETQGTVGNLSSDVSGVKQDVSSAKEQIASTKNDLQRAVGDLGVQSGLIAHNGQELAELKLLGEREYHEFDVRKNSQPQRVGNIAITLKRTDVKRQKFTIDLIVDDRTIEKKDKTVNEPVQFYQDGYRQPTEIVANQIYKDRIVGYVSVPKKKEARITASAAQPGLSGF